MRSFNDDFVSSAILTFFATIIIRSLGWLLLGIRQLIVGHRTNGMIFVLTAVVVIIGGFLFISGIDIAWVFYSTFEAFSYYRIKRYIFSDFPLLVFSSVPAILLLLISSLFKLLFVRANDVLLYIVLALLLISSSAVTVGFFRLIKEKGQNLPSGTSMKHEKWILAVFILIITMAFVILSIKHKFVSIIP